MVVVTRAITPARSVNATTTLLRASPRSSVLSKHTLTVALRYGSVLSSHAKK
jgi:hypothetical protein